MTDQPGVAFWATVVAIAAMVYVLSSGPAVWLHERQLLSDGVVTTLYDPLFRTCLYGPRPIRRASDWYLSLWSKKSDEGIFYDPIQRTLE